MQLLKFITINKMLSENLRKSVVNEHNILSPPVLMWTVDCTALATSPLRSWGQYLAAN